MTKKKAADGELNVADRTLFICDNAEVLDGLNSGCADLIYLDPPFNSNRHYAAPMGSRAAGASFKDAWTLEDVDVAWAGQIAERHPGLAAVINAAGLCGGRGDRAYLIFMARRLLELHRILKASGGIYLHCDPTMSHSLKMLMDAIFGKRRFLNEIVWGYEKPRPAKRMWRRNHDVLFFYGGGGAHTFHPQRVAAANAGLVMRRPFKRPDGSVWHPKQPGKQAGSWWADIPSFATRMTAKERTGYPTQKPLALLERIIRASSNEGDVVLDPFCGCATSLVAAEKLGRRWTGIDISPKATDLVRMRLQDAQDMLSAKGAWRKVSVRTEAPARTDEGNLMVNPREYRHELYGMQDGKCAGCRHWFPFRNMTTDHIEAGRGEDSRNARTNLQLLCGACNSVKGARPMSYLLAWLKKAGII